MSTCEFAYFPLFGTIDCHPVFTLPPSDELLLEESLEHFSTTRTKTDDKGSQALSPAWQSRAWQAWKWLIYVC